MTPSAPDSSSRRSRSFATRSSTSLAECLGSTAQREPSDIAAKGVRVVVVLTSVLLVVGDGHKELWKDLFWGALGDLHVSSYAASMQLGV